MNMIVNYRRWLGALLPLVAAGLLFTVPAWADAGDSPDVEAQRLVHILGYTAADYGGAVSNGAVTSPTEFAEQLALLAEAGKIATRLEAVAPKAAPAGSKRHDLAAEVAAVRALVEAKATEKAVADAVVDVRGAIMAAYHLSEAPSSPPDHAHGKALYEEHCATCHGATGHADTPRAASLTPHPADFLDARIGDPLTPLRIAGTVRFGIDGTAMVPFTFLSDADRWALGFYVAGLRHTAAPAADAPGFTLTELAVHSDVELRDELRAAGIADDRHEAMLADLRRRAPYEDRTSRSALALARAKLGRAKSAIRNGDRGVARGNIIDAYLDGIEPAEGPLRALDGSIVPALEESFVTLRGRLEAGAAPAEIETAIGALAGEVTRAEMLLAASADKRSFLSTAISSGGILLREGVEAALLIAALLGVAAQAGLANRKRYVHAGWGSALVLGVATWFFSAHLIAISGASREVIEGATAVLASIVLFYVSYSLLAKKEVARWMRFLRGQVSPRRAAVSLFGVAFLAAYREAFETVLFYQALLASKASTGAALVGALGGALVLGALVAMYTRAGKFAPPQVFFKVSSYLLYFLAVVFAGQGIAALQLAGYVPIHRVGLPSLPALGLYPTLETAAAQGLLIALALVGVGVGRLSVSAAPQSSGNPKPAA